MLEIAAAAATPVGPAEASWEVMSDAVNESSPTSIPLLDSEDDMMSSSSSSSSSEIPMFEDVAAWAMTVDTEAEVDELAAAAAEEAVPEEGFMAKAEGFPGCETKDV